MVPYMTQWLKMSGNNLGTVLKVKSYMNEISYTDISLSNIHSISEDAINTMLTNAKYLDVRNNELEELPVGNAVSNNSTQLWISNNPYECNCDMLRMRDWLVQATNVMDKENVICASGKLKGELCS